MPLKILNRPVRTAPGTINYSFRELLEALDLLGNKERTWFVSGARVTWPEELLDERMEVHDPRIRFLRDGHDFACTQEVLVQIAGDIEGDWTDILVSSIPFQKWDGSGSEDLEKVDHRAVGRLDQWAISQHVLFRCIDAAFWVIESAAPDLPSKLASHGFATEPYKAPSLRGRW